MIVVDTTVWVDYFRNRSTPHTQWLDQHIAVERLAILDLILCEVLQGISDQKEFQHTLLSLQDCEIFPTGGSELAIRAAKHYQTLRKRGITVRKTIDCLIATFCLSKNHSLLHNDRDFDGFEHLGLHVIHP